jgi:hypothetical protein
MAKIEKGTAHPGYFTVMVDKNELRVDSGKTLPFPTWIGTIQKNGRINVWTPAASGIPRGYKQAAKRMLEDARQQLCERGEVACKTRR